MYDLVETTKNVFSDREKKMRNYPVNKRVMFREIAPVISSCVTNAIVYHKFIKVASMNTKENTREAINFVNARDLCTSPRA